eukprot:731283-Amphidinium_carterae.1
MEVQSQSNTRTSNSLWHRMMTLRRLSDSNPAVKSLSAHCACHVLQSMSLTCALVSAVLIARGALGVSQGVMSEISQFVKSAATQTQ